MISSIPADVEEVPPPGTLVLDVTLPTNWDSAVLQYDGVKWVNPQWADSGIIYPKNYVAGQFQDYANQQVRYVEVRGYLVLHDYYSDTYLNMNLEANFLGTGITKSKTVTQTNAVVHVVSGDVPLWKLNSLMLYINNNYYNPPSGVTRILIGVEAPIYTYWSYKQRVTEDS